MMERPHSPDDTPSSLPVCDYEGSPYRIDFWAGGGRNYEDLTERAALRALLPPHGRRVVHLGAGFGRTSSELSGYDEVIVLDYSHSMLRDAQARLGTGGRYRFVAADIYHLPLADGSCDAAVMERVIHHMVDVPAALAQIRAVLAPGAPFVLEYANKRNMKAIMRYALKRQEWNPFDLEPVELSTLIFNFLPKTMNRWLRAARFKTRRELAVSYFRLGQLKRAVPMSLLVGLDRLLQPTGKIEAFSPSVFTLNTAIGDQPPAALDGPLFKCLHCGMPLHEEGDEMICPRGDGRWAIREGIYDFRPGGDE